MEKILLGVWIPNCRSNKKDARLEVWSDNEGNTTYLEYTIMGGPYVLSREKAHEYIYTNAVHLIPNLD